MTRTTDFAHIAAEVQQQSFTMWKDAVEKSFDLGAQLFSLQREYALRAVDILGARVSESA
jgi:phage gp46-like protein